MNKAKGQKGTERKEETSEGAGKEWTENTMAVLV